MEVIERRIPNSDENRFIELIKTRDYICRFRGRSRSRLLYFKMYISEDVLGNNSQAKVQVIEGVYFDNYPNLSKGKNVRFTCRVADIFVLGLN